MLNLQNLDVLDPPDVDQTNFGPDMKRWLSNIVDVINFNFLTLKQLSFYVQNLIKSEGVNVGGGGVSVNVPVVGLTPSGFVTVTLISSSNTAEVASVTPLTNSFNLIFNNNPGASAIIVYQAYIAKPQTEF